MPAAIVLGHLNRMLATPGSPEYTSAQAACTGAGSLKDAVVAAGVLASHPQEIQTEAHTVLDAVPPDVDSQILGAVRDAFTRQVPVHFSWTHADPGTAISHRVVDAGGRVHIEIVAPDGRTLTP